MTFRERCKNFLEKLRNLPEKKKKIILWTIVVILGLFMGFFWMKETISGVSEISKEVQSVKISQLLQTTTPTNK